MEMIAGNGPQHGLAKHTKCDPLVLRLVDVVEKGWIHKRHIAILLPVICEGLFD